MLNDLEKIKELVELYYKLEHKALIENHTELIQVFEINNEREIEHPHIGMCVHISRMSLKHFTDRRKEELQKYHSDIETIENIFFAIERLQDIVQNFDFYEYEPPIKHSYVKDFSHFGKPLLKVILEHKENRLEIKSIHFKKNRKKNTNKKTT